MANVFQAIKDWLGRPVKKSILSKDLAEPSLTGVRTVWQTSIANALTPQNLANVLSEVDAGDSISYLTLAEEMEERYMHYNSVLGDRKRAVTGLPKRIDSFSDDADDIAVADAVRELIESDEFDAMLFDLMDGIGKGYSAVELTWDTSSVPWIPRYKWRDPRFFQFDLTAGDELRIRDEADLVNGVELPPYKFMVHRPKIKSGLTLRSGLARAACVAYMLQGYTLKDWWAFMEVYGMPWRIGKYAPKASEEQKTALLTAVRQMGVDAACIIPEDMVINIVETSKTNGGDKLFQGSADWLNDQVSKVVVGQIASTHGTPGRLGNEDSQDAVRKDIKIDDARQLGATVRRDLIRPFVDLNFPNRVGGPYPLFHIVSDEPEDIEWLRDKVADLVDRGLKLQMSEVRDKLGFDDPEDDAELLHPKSTATPKPSGESPPEGEPEPTEEGDEPAPDEVQLQREAIASIWTRIKQGSSVTPEERQLLVAWMATAADSRHQDEIDKLVADELDGAVAAMDPLLDPVLAHAKRSGSYKEFLDGLEEVLANVDSTEIARLISVATFKARGMGDATDEV